jgi:hypothetical protein
MTDLWFWVIAVMRVGMAKGGMPVVCTLGVPALSKPAHAGPGLI